MNFDNGGRTLAGWKVLVGAWFDRWTDDSYVLVPALGLRTVF